MTIKEIKDKKQFGKIFVKAFKKRLLHIPITGELSMKKWGIKFGGLAFIIQI
jgi:uncharacterized membrane protein (DUF485 family)